MINGQSFVSRSMGRGSERILSFRAALRLIIMSR